MSDFINTIYNYLYLLEKNEGFIYDVCFYAQSNKSPFKFFFIYFFQLFT